MTMNYYIERGFIVSNKTGFQHFSISMIKKEKSYFVKKEKAHEFIKKLLSVLGTNGEKFKEILNSNSEKRYYIEDIAEKNYFYKYAKQF